MNFEPENGDDGKPVAALVIRTGAVCKCCLVPFKDEPPGDERVCRECWDAAGIVEGEDGECHED